MKGNTVITAHDGPDGVRFEVRNRESYYSVGEYRLMRWVDGVLVETINFFSVISAREKFEKAVTALYE